MASQHSKPFGLLAEFQTTSALYHACEKVRDAGYTVWDAHTPFPVHGLDKAMGLKPTMLSWIVLVAGLGGTVFAIVAQWWLSAVDYPIIISGKPLFSWQAFIPITFEVMVISSVFAIVFGLFHLTRLPRLHHPLFSSARFERASDDRFFISIEASDPKFNREQTHKLLETLGSSHVELIEE